MGKFIKSCRSKVKGIFVGIGAGAGALISAPAYAAIDLTGVSVDTADYVAIATFLVTALVAFWGIRKGLALLGR